jgi:hypothetical protein
VQHRKRMYREGLTEKLMQKVTWVRMTTRGGQSRSGLQLDVGW